MSRADYLAGERDEARLKYEQLRVAATKLVDELDWESDLSTETQEAHNDLRQLLTKPDRAAS